MESKLYLVGNIYCILCFVVLAEDAIKAALADYKVKQGEKKVELSN